MNQRFDRKMASNGWIQVLPGLKLFSEFLSHPPPIQTDNFVLVNVRSKKDSIPECTPRSYPGSAGCCASIEMWSQFAVVVDYDTFHKMFETDRERLHFNAICLIQEAHGKRPSWNEQNFLWNFMHKVVWSFEISATPQRPQAPGHPSPLLDPFRLLINLTTVATRVTTSPTCLSSVVTPHGWTALICLINDVRTANRTHVRHPLQRPGGITQCCKGADRGASWTETDSEGQGARLLPPRQEIFRWFEPWTIHYV